MLVPLLTPTGLDNKRQMAMLPAWIAYSVACGTAATGAWVVAHECGHGAFSNNRKLQDAVGFVLHVRILIRIGSILFTA